MSKDESSTQSTPSGRETDAEHKKSLRRSWRSASPVTKLTVVFTGVIAVATVLYCGFSGWQLYEIHSGSKDTHGLAVAAGKQADAAKALAEQAKAQTANMAESLSKTDALIKEATNQAIATNKLALAAQQQVAKLDAQVTETHALAKAAADQSAISAKALTANQRPWVSFDVRIVSPLTFDVEGAHISMAVTFKNTGGSTAVGSGFWIEMFREKPPIVMNGMLAERNRVCQRALDETGLSKAIFVGTPRTDTWHIGMPAEEVARQVATMGLFSADIIGCVGYRSPVNETVAFETASVMFLSRDRYIDAKGTPSFAIIPPAPVPVAELHLAQDPVLGLSVK